MLTTACYCLKNSHSATVSKLSLTVTFFDEPYSQIVGSSASTIFARLRKRPNLRKHMECYALRLRKQP